MLDKSKCLINVKTLAILFSLIFSQGYAQNQFQIAIGGPQSESIGSIVQSSDGSYTAIGDTYSFGDGYWNMYVVKINANGTLQWSKVIGNNGYPDRGYTILQTTGGYLAVGWTNSFGTHTQDVFLVKLDTAGNLLWSKTLGGSGSDGVTGIKSTVQTSDGGFAIAGFTTSFGAGAYDWYFIKIDSGGAVQWSKAIGGTGTEYADAIIQTGDGGYVVSGMTTSFGIGSYYDVFVTKLDSTGNLQWSKTVGSAGMDYPYGMIQTSEGGCILTGNTNSFGAGDYDIYLVKFDANGTLIWNKTVGGTGLDQGRTIIPAWNGGYIISGSTTSFGAGSSDIYVVKIDTGGTVQLSKTIGGTNNDYGSNIIQTINGGYMIGGSTQSYGVGSGDFYFVKLDATVSACGNSTPITSLAGIGGTSTSRTPTVTSVTTIVNTVTPLVVSGGTRTSICSVSGIEINSNEIPREFSLSQNYPNPFNPVTKIKFDIPSEGKFPLRKGGLKGVVSLKVFDIAGKEVATLVNEQLQPGTYEVEFDGSNLPSGVYFYKLTTESFTTTKCMMLIK